MESADKQVGDRGAGLGSSEPAVPDVSNLDVPALHETVTRVFTSLAMPTAHAETVATVTIDADLAGRPSHGVVRIPAYADKVRAGGLNVRAEPEIVQDSGAVFVIDGHDGFGQVAVSRALELGLERSRRYGIAWGAVRATSNAGMLASYALRAASEGHVSIIACNAAPSMPPHAGAEAFFGTNPLCIGIPRQEGPFPILDMASTAVSKGVIRAAARDGATIPEGWATDAAGKPTTDPQKALEGLLQPLGGPKGSGLAMMIDVLAGLLGGGRAGDELRGLHSKEPSGVGALVIVARPDAFGPAGEFEGRLEAYLERLSAVPPASPRHPLRFPGERGWVFRQRCLAEGVPVPVALWRDLQRLAMGS